MVLKKFKVNNFFKIIQLIFLFNFPVITFADDIKGSGWSSIDEDGDKKNYTFWKRCWAKISSNKFNVLLSKVYRTYIIIKKSNINNK